MAMVCHRHVYWCCNRDWFGVVANEPRITQNRKGEWAMTYRRTIREWMLDARDKARQYGEVAIALAMMAGASFIGAAAAHWVFGP
jgi:uncharacterized protein YegJ (DUF2314 family)